MRKTTTLHVRHTCCYISLRSLHDREMKFPNSMFYVGQKHKTMIFSFFLNLDMVLENSVPKKFAYCWQINRNGIFAMRFETAQTHFVIKVFAAVAVVVA